MTTTSENNINHKIVKLQKDFFDLNKMFELSKIVNQSSDLQTLANGVVHFLHLTLNVGSVSFYIKDNQSVFKQMSSFNLNQRYQFEEDHDVIWRFLKEGKPLAVRDELGTELYQSFFVKYSLDDLKPNLMLPINQGNDILGMFIIGEPLNGEFYTNDDMKFFAKVIDYLAPVFVSRKQEEDKSKEISNLQKTLHNISILYNIGQAMNFIDDLKGLLTIILDKAIKTIGAQKGSLMLYDFASNNLQVKVVYGLPDKEVEEKINSGLKECTRIKVGEGIAGNVFLSRTSIITNLGENDPRFSKSAESHVDSILCVPLVVKGEAIGVINITNKNHGNLFNQEDLEFMEALANQAAIAIDNAKLYELATKDGLTKLYIHRQFYSLLENEYKRATRFNHNLALLMIDIDDFKKVNDIYGHPAGDQVLREISAVLLSTVRKIDYACRYGGEEFSVILPETSAFNARVLATRLRKKIEDLEIKVGDGVNLKLTVSIGVAELTEEMRSENELVEHSDKALYFAKEHGKNAVAEYNKLNCEIVT